MKLFCFVAILLIAVSQVAGYITFNFQEDAPQLLASYQGTVGPNDPATERDGFSVPLNSYGAVSFELSASASMSVCASPDSLVQNIDNCPPGNRLDFVFDNATQTYSAQTSFFGATSNQTQDLYLLLDRTYYVTVALNETVELSGNSTDFTLQVYSTGECKGDEIYSGNSCTKPVNSYYLSDKKENNISILANSNNLYLINTTTITENVVSITFEITFFSSSSFSAFAPVTYPSVYLRRGAAPLYANGVASADTITISSGTQQTIVYSVENPIPDPVGWFIAFDSSVAVNASLLLTYDSCSGVLIGSNCSITPLDLATFFSQSSEGLLLAVNNTGNVDYFYWYASNHLIVGAADREYKNTPPNLYASTSTPSNITYLYSDDDTDVPAHLINVEIFTNPTYYYIAVYATDNYWIWYGRPCAGNCTSLTTGLDDAVCLECSGHGTCQNDQGVCTCNKGYKNFACSTRGLAIIWIILISIGGAIVLALAIGIPVGCYIKNRKRARYERV